ncbi:hypothetical protein [Solimonas sp. SE-A11]|jgi:hypothetical protein|uniref:hypothetical protein n=1 Tax=Solimonas sp. SE-A11 TaxID=3054954 RepID=UPI00259CB354|nr:hypothetical protein [Solimonas sp. SE-A11]MDM4771387.1 hypothetical protein [Solimonas sp. SE-A11]
MNIHLLIVRFTRAMAAAALLGAAATGAWAHPAQEPPAPGSFAAIMSVKDPGNYGPKAVSDAPISPRGEGLPGSFEAVMSVKDPAHWGPKAGVNHDGCPTQSASPGSYEAVMAVKDPGRFGPEPCRR